MIKFGRTKAKSFATLTFGCDQCFDRHDHQISFLKKKKKKTLI